MYEKLGFYKIKKKINFLWVIYLITTVCMLDWDVENYWELTT